MVSIMWLFRCEFMVENSGIEALVVGLCMIGFFNIEVYGVEKFGLIFYDSCVL